MASGKRVGFATTPFLNFVYHPWYCPNLVETKNWIPIPTSNKLRKMGLRRFISKENSQLLIEIKKQIQKELK